MPFLTTIVNLANKQYQVEIRFDCVNSWYIMGLAEEIQQQLLLTAGAHLQLNSSRIYDSPMC